MKAFGLLLGASVLTFAWSGEAMAQATADAPATAATQSSQPSQTDNPPAAETNDTSQGEIVVTAQRRSENLMTTPVAASVISGGELSAKGVGTVDSLQFVTPSLVVNNFGQGNDFNVRGIGKAEHNTQTETGVITYRDGVPAFPGYFQEEPYYDIANIQVLRGPQGTTVGQNATGGAVFVNTNDPIIGGGVHGYFTANYGNYNDLGGEGAINLPVSDTFAMRVAIHGERRDGFYHITGPGGTPYTGNNGDLRQIAGRISLLWKPTDRLSILLKTDLDYLDNGAYPADPYTDRFQFLPYGSTTPNPNYRDLFHITADTPMAARDKFVRSILRIQYEFAGGIKFRSITGGARGTSYYLTDLDGTATAPAETFGDTFVEKQYSQEFDLISPDNQRFTWLLGAFGLWDKDVFPAPYSLFIDLPGLGVPDYYDLQGTVIKHSYAAFGEVGYNITSNLKLDLSGRYTTSQATNHVLVRQFGTLVTPDEQATKSDNFSYKASLGWKVDHDNYLYALVATGFRPGGLNTPDIQVPVSPAPFKPETVRSFEAGWKANLADGHVRTTIDGFYNQYKNFQAILGRPTNPALNTELNIPGTTKIYGFEAEGDFNFGPLSFSAGINLLHSKVPDFYTVDPRTVPAFNPPLPPCSPSTGPATTAAIGACTLLTGRQQSFAPNLTFDFSAQYEIHLGAKDTLTPRVNFGHVGPQWATLFEDPAFGDRLGARNILNAQLAWSHSSWTVTAYATNLTNLHYVGSLNSGLDFAGPPRQYGIKVLKTF